MPLPPEEQRLYDHIEQRGSALLEDLRLHVGLPTGHNNTAGLDESRERFRVRLTALHAESQLIPGDPKPPWLFGSPANTSIPPTLVCRRSAAAGTSAKRILIAGHLDTVHDPRGPFRSLTIAADGKTATGPGVVDMKGGLVIAIGALEALEACGLEVPWTVLLNSDEETGSYHSDSAIVAEAKRHDFGLALEPAMSKGELAVSRGGSAQFVVETFGKSAHVGRDFAAGISAVTSLAQAVIAAGELSDPARGVNVNIGPLQGGNATNVVPDYARAWGNARFQNPQDAVELAKRLEELASKGSPEAVPRTVVHHSFNRPAKPLTPETADLAKKALAVAQDLGQALPFASTGGVCDGNVMQAAGLPTIDTLGVRGGGLHTLQEWIEIPSLVERCQLLAILLLRLARS